MKNLLILGILSTMMFANSILDNILLPNITNAKKVAIQMQNDEKNLKKDFSKLVYAWKKVEAFYIAGDIDELAYDTARFIDVYHNLNENIHEQLQRALKSDKDLKKSLFKTSLKSINALEYVLFAKESLNKRDIEATKIILSFMIGNLSDIEEIYKNAKTWLNADIPRANTAYMNALDESAYKLKEWRVGEVIGLAGKYKNKGVDLRRAEYALSKNSFVAIEAILDTYEQVIGVQDYKNFANIAQEDAASDLEKARKALKESKMILKSIKNENFNDKNMPKLYKSLKELYISYAIYMVGSLSITSKIVEADGD